jgi:hypothetical protein
MERHRDWATVKQEIYDLARVELLGYRRADKSEVGETQEIGLERHLREESWRVIGMG